MTTKKVQVPHWRVKGLGFRVCRDSRQNIAITTRAFARNIRGRNIIRTQKRDHSCHNLTCVCSSWLTSSAENRRQGPQQNLVSSHKKRRIPYRPRNTVWYRDPPPNRYPLSFLETQIPGRSFRPRQDYSDIFLTGSKVFLNLCPFRSLAGRLAVCLKGLLGAIYGHVEFKV